MQNQNQGSNYVAPQGQIQGQQAIPSGGQRKEKRTDVSCLPMGMNPGILVGLVDLGTQEVQFNNGPIEQKRQMQFLFEFPQLKQLYYVEDTEPRTHMVMKTSTFSVAPKAFLKALIDAKEKRVVDAREAENYDLSSLLGVTFGVMTTQQQSKKTQLYYDKITGVSSIGNYPIPPNFNREIDYSYFIIDCDRYGNVIGQNFLTKNYADIYPFLKKQILASSEAKAYIQRGGQFAKNPEEQTQAQQQQTPVNVQQPQGQKQQQYQQPQGQGQPQQQQGQNQQQYQQPQQQHPQGPPNHQQPQQGQQQFQPQQQAPPQGQQQFQQPQQGGGFDPNAEDNDDLPF